MSPSVPKTVIFLTADAYGVLPPISKLDRNQAMYYFVSGFTSKVAGTEIGVTEPVPTFSTCFGEPFLPLDPSVYAAMLAEKVEKAGAKVYLVNTGWNGTGQRMKLRYTRAMVTAALTGAIEKADFVTDPTLYSQAAGTPLNGVRVVVSQAKGEKCERCWMHSPTVGADADHPTLCARCAAVVRKLPQF